MAALYDITGRWRELYDLADDPDMDADVWIDTMESIEGELEAKAEGYAKVMTQINADKKAIDDEISRLQAKASVLGNKVDRLKACMKQSMESTGRDKLKAGTFTFSVCKNGGKQPLVMAEGVTAADVPEEYRTYPEPVINSQAVRDALDAGQELEFAHYGERGTHLRLK